MTRTSEHRWASNFVKVGTIRTHYVEAGSGDPVVLVHGGGPGASGLHGWTNIIPPLAEQFRVLAIDVLGFGDTDKPSGLQYSHQDQVDHLAAFIETLCLEPVKLVGNSMGAYLCAKCSLDHPGMVERIFAVSSGTIAYAMGLPNPQNPGREALRDFDGSERGLRQFLEAILRDPPSDELVKSRVAKANEEGAMEAWRAMSVYNRRLATDSDLWQRFQIRDRLPLSNVPMKILWGEDDAFAPVEQAYALRDLLPRVQIDVLENAGHQCQNDRPDEVSRQVMEFLEVDLAARSAGA